MKVIFNFSDGTSYTNEINDFSIEVDKLNPARLMIFAPYENVLLNEMSSLTQKTFSNVSIFEDEKIIYEDSSWKNINQISVRYNSIYKKMIASFSIGAE